MADPVPMRRSGEPPADAAREAEVQSIARELRCLVCQNESIADSRSALAEDLRRWLRERLDAGATRAEVLDELVQRYGEFIRYTPPVDVRTLPLWAAPGLFVVGGAVALLLVLRRRQRLASATEENDTLPGGTDSGWR